MKLCPHLQKILDYELQQGNIIQDQGKLWTKMNFAIYMEKSMDIDGIENILLLDDCVHFSKSEDPHYMMQGFYCETCNHTIDGPLNL